MSIATDIELAKITKPVRILTIDIETAPHTVYAFGLFKQNISLSQIKEPGRVLCFVAKWLGEDKIIFKSEYHDSQEEMVQAAWDLLNEADVVIHYNGNNFDIPWLNGQFYLNKLGPTSPFKNIDLLHIVRKFRFASSKLDWALQVSGLGNKVKHAGFEMWADIMGDDEERKAAAWKEMRKYNIGDVTKTEDLYINVRPWIHNHPHTGFVADKDTLLCNKCNSANLTQTGTWRAVVNEYALFRCECGGYVRSNKTVGRAGNTAGVK